jgi:nucleoside-diphosphate kinase
MKRNVNQSKSDSPFMGVNNPCGEATLVIIRPDAIARGLVGNIISRIEVKGLEIVAMRMYQMNLKEARKLYEPLGNFLGPSLDRQEDIFGKVVQFMTSAPSIVMVVTGNKAIDILNAMKGHVNCAKALPGTIRGDMGIAPTGRSFEHNLVHISETVDDFKREIKIFGWLNELMYKTPQVAVSKVISSKEDSI